MYGLGISIVNSFGDILHVIRFKNKVLKIQIHREFAKNI